MAMTSSKVERLAALIDDKTMISSLIRDGSDRIRLIEFKDARADIWHYFRLVQLDGHTLPYAVCIRCMKPVSYKAREGTGGLHRHPCSKASAFVSGIPISRNSQRAVQYSKMCGTSLGAECSSTLDSQSALQVNKALCILPNSSVQSGYVYNGNGTVQNKRVSLDDSTEFEKIVIDAVCNSLIPLNVINDSTFVRLFATEDKINKTRLISILHHCYDSAKQETRLLLSRQTHVTFVADLWTEEVTERRFLSVWAYFMSMSTGCEVKQILSTKDVTFTFSKDEIVEEVDKVRKEMYSSSKSFVYIFDNYVSTFADHFHDNHLICVCHQLHELMNASLTSSEILLKQINSVLKLCALNGNSKVAESVRDIERYNSCRFRLELLKVINDNYDEIEDQIIMSIDKESLQEVCNFVSLLLNAVQTLSSESIGSTLTLVGLWRAKLEDNCKSADNDCPLLHSIKQNVRNALKKSKLHHPLYLMSVCLDPRFKRLKMLTEEMREKTYSFIKNSIGNETQIETIKEDLKPVKKESKEECIVATPVHNETLDFDGSEECSAKRIKVCDPLPKAFNEYLDCCDDSGKDELEIYLGLDVGQIQPHEFWNSEHGRRMPRLRSLAQRLLSIPAVPSYCQLSPSGQEFCIRRKNINENYFDQILFLHTFNKMSK